MVQTYLNPSLLLIHPRIPSFLAVYPDVINSHIGFSKHRYIMDYHGISEIIPFWWFCSHIPIYKAGFSQDFQPKSSDRLWTWRMKTMPWDCLEEAPWFSWAKWGGFHDNLMTYTRKMIGYDRWWVNWRKIRWMRYLIKMWNQPDHFRSVYPKTILTRGIISSRG